jgi:hypothetical protein
MFAATGDAIALNATGVEITPVCAPARRIINDTR